ncbi:MAG: hypothetical protein IPJ98_26050 [Bryobacterales bacterium]|nr:hypothetical protein [Bryobacterales bacterium]
MPFCTQCGSQVTPADTYCHQCGSQQPDAAPGAPPPRPSGSQNNFTDTIDDRTWKTLCYMPGLGWLASVFVLAADRFTRDRTARFHAFQGLYLFVAWLVIDWGLGPAFQFGRSSRLDVEGLVKLALFGVGIFMMIKTWHGQIFRLPIFSELADRSLADHP